jgi:hypothetical protein
MTFRLTAYTAACDMRAYGYEVNSTEPLDRNVDKIIFCIKGSVATGRVWDDGEAFNVVT